MMNLVKIATILIVLISVSNALELDNNSHYLDYNECLNVTFNDSWALLCAPSFPTINENKFLVFNETYINSPYNLTVKAPPVPEPTTLNQTISLNWGDNYTNNIVNLSVSCLPLPSVNINLSAGQIYNQYSINARCLYPTFNINKTLDFGSSYINNDIGLNVSCVEFPRIGANIQLDYGQQYTTPDARYNFTATCKYVNLIQCNDFETSYKNTKTELEALKTSCTDKDTEITNNLKTIEILRTNITILENKPILSRLDAENSNCAMTQISINGKNLTYCPEDITSLCSPDEKLIGNFAGCIGRLANETVVQREQLTQQLTVCTTDKNRCETGETLNQQNADRFIIIIIGFAAALGGGWLLTEYLKHKRTAESE